MPKQLVDKRVRRRRRKTGARGYGAPHRVLRAAVARVVAAGRALCARCGEPILVGEAWDLDHRDDRRGYLGPSHRRCNRSTSKKRVVSRTW